MNRVDVILTCCLNEEEAIQKLNDHIAANNNGQPLDNLSKWPLGMGMMANVLFGSFDGLEIKKLLTSALKAKWNSPEDVRLMILEEKYGGFSVSDLRGVYYELQWRKFANED